jgi:hypothetical protein
MIWERKGAAAGASTEERGERAGENKMKEKGKKGRERKLS